MDVKTAWLNGVGHHAKKGGVMSAEVNPVGWFEIPVTDMDRAKAFYEHTFGLELEQHEMGEGLMAWFAMKEDVYGTAGSLVKAEGYEPGLEGILIYFTAPDIEATLSRAKEKGGVVLTEKSSIGEYGFYAVVQDTEGNRIGLHSRE
jgi:predicted enzyme related to lactoylglutathione lyase